MCWLHHSYTDHYSQSLSYVFVPSSVCSALISKSPSHLRGNKTSRRHWQQTNCVKRIYVYMCHIGISDQIDLWAVDILFPSLKFALFPFLAPPCLLVCQRVGCDMLLQELSPKTCHEQITNKKHFQIHQNLFHDSLVLFFCTLRSLYISCPLFTCLLFLSISFTLSCSALWDCSAFRSTAVSCVIWSLLCKS